MPHLVFWKLCRSFKYFIGDPYESTGRQPMFVPPVGASSYLTPATINGQQVKPSP